MRWEPVKSELTGRICHVKNYQSRGSGYGRVMTVFENEAGERAFAVVRAHPYGGYYIFPQKGEIFDEEMGTRRVRTIVSVMRDQEKWERKVRFVNRDGKCVGRDRRLKKKGTP